MKLGVMQGRLSLPVDGHIQEFPIHWMGEFMILQRSSLSHLEWLVTERSFINNPILVPQYSLNHIPISSICADNLVNEKIADREFLFSNLIPICEGALKNGVPRITIPLLEDSSVEDDEKRSAFSKLISELAFKYRSSLKFSFEAELEPKKLVLEPESEYISYNNTLVANRGGYSNLFSDGVVNNDIIINSGWGNSVYLDAYSTFQISHSNIEGGYEGVGNIDINPLFSNAENDDYSLQLDSPCIDAGTADLDDDGIDDIINYYGLAPDMGVYEYESEYDLSFGDVNFDNEINILDVVLMVSFILGEPTDEYELSASDINQDGLLNILDIVALVNIILIT